MPRAFAVPIPVRAHREPVHRTTARQAGDPPRRGEPRIETGQMKPASMRLHSWRLAIPGVALTLGLAFVARFGSSDIALHWMNGKASPISPMLLGIVFGMLWRHFIGLSSNAQQGVQWILGTILHIGIALVGLRLTLGGLADVGPAAFAIVAACVMDRAPRELDHWPRAGIVERRRGLLAVGSAVCGCTAIVAASPAIRARPIETGAALSCVVLIGSLGMLF